MIVGPGCGGPLMPAARTGSRTAAGRQRGRGRRRCAYGFRVEQEAEAGEAVAFGLTMTLVWLSLEILRLLSYLRWW
ncbi:Bax inhibitor-1/YccA family membrane protein [Streptomyces sp. NPDC054765]